VWGVKKSRPVFTYRVREVATLIICELKTPQYQEVASVLHMYVFNLLAQREGKAHKTSRDGGIDYGSKVRAMKDAVAEAKAEVTQRSRLMQDSGC
jgi:hypothetical protein